MHNIKMDLKEIGWKMWPEFIRIGTTDGLL
jgi:hypothetical protein